MKESKLFKSLVATFVVIVLGGPAVVLAGTPSDVEVSEITVSYADLNLDTEQGVQTLYRRLQRASKEVSGLTTRRDIGSIWFSQKTRQFYRTTRRDIGSIWFSRKTRQFYRNALSNAVEKIDNERLSEIHAG